MRAHYAHITDVVRKYNPQLTEQNIRDGELLRNQDEDQLWAAIEDAEARFESRTGNPQREVRVGEPSRPRTWETHSADLRRHQAGIKFWLDNKRVRPLDPDKGDSIQIRRGRHDWQDITANTERYNFDHTKGWVRVFTRFAGGRYLRKAAQDKALRITYRHGAPGGTRRVPGQTELTAKAASGDTTLSVEDPTMMPRGNAIAFLGGTEYVSVTGRNPDAGTVDVARGVRATDSKSHSAGSTLHYCPLSVREGIAARAAKELLTHEGWVTELASGEGLDTKSKMQEWQEMFDETVGEFAEVRAL